MINRDDLFQWQDDAYRAWVSSGAKGIVVAPTASGKTTFALFCMQEMRTSTIIIVPTIVLMEQWRDEILKQLDIPKDKVGLYYGEEKNFQPITIAVINSVREKDLSMFNMCVLDEIHRFASLENIRPLKKSVFMKKLGMTATL
jgi:superfamily II DNA or RNA helicase